MEIERSRIAQARYAIQQRLNDDEMYYEADEADLEVRMAENKAQLSAAHQPNKSDLASMPPGWFSGVRNQS